MLFSEFKQDATDVLGNCVDTRLWARTSDAIRLLGNKARWDWTLGDMSISSEDGLVTLPREVKTVLATAVDKRPALLRDEWFEFHINGAGEENTVPCGYTTEIGRWATFRDPPKAVKLIAVVDSVTDTNKKLRVYGEDTNGNRIFTPDASGKMQDGFLVPQIYGYPVPRADVPDIARIEKITRDQTTARVKLYAVDPVTLETLTVIGHYWPNEVTPSYRRIRINAPSTVRIKYQRADIPIQGDEDWINTENKEALRLALRAVKLREDSRFDAAKVAEGEAVRLLSEEQESLRPPAQSGPQIIDESYRDDPERLFYSC